MTTTTTHTPHRLSWGIRRASPRAMLALAVAIVATVPLRAQDDAGAGKYAMDIRYNIPVQARDGVKISVDVFRPRDASKHPAVMLQTPYNNDGDNVMDEAWSYVKRGYAYVTVDVRGRYDSDTTVGVGPSGVTIGPRQRCRTVTTQVERDDGRRITRRERVCD